MDSNRLPPVVLIHGMWGQPSVWANWQAMLESAGYRCHALRLPGHRADADRSTLETLGRTGLRDYVAAARAVVESLPTPPIVIGHSLGGLITQILAAEVPLSAAVLLCPAAPAAVFPLRPISLPGLIRSFSRPGLWHKPFRLAPAEAAYLIFNAIPQAQRGPLIDELVHESGRVAYEVAFGRLNLRRTNTVCKDAITCPMLAIAGQLDHIVPVGVSRNIAKWYGAKLTYWEYPDHAHWPLGEHGWEHIVGRLLKWLGESLH